MATNSFKEAIREYLEQRSKQDTLFAVTYAKPNKSVDECCNYIMKEARKRGNAVCMRDDEVFGLAVHYYDEDSIKDVNPVSATVTTSAPASDMIARARMRTFVIRDSSVRYSSA